MNTTVSALADCPPMDVATVTVTPSTSQPSVNHTQTTNQLKNFDLTTESPYGHTADVRVNGLMRGRIAIDTNIGLEQSSNSGTNETCFAYNHVNVTIKIDPIIYIARELERGSCRYGAVLEHEVQHVNIDRKLVNEYKTFFEREIRNYIQRTGVLGPYPMSKAAPVQKQMISYLEQKMKSLNEQLQAERRIRQAAIDTIDEYNRIDMKCIRH